MIARQEILRIGRECAAGVREDLRCALKDVREAKYGPGEVASLTVLDGIGMLIDREMAKRGRKPPWTRIGREAVVFIPGWAQSGEALGAMASRVAQIIQTSVFIAITPEEGGNCDLYQRMLARNLELLVELTNFDRVVLVGYSRGGHNAVHFAQWLLEHGFTHDRVSLCTIATPHDGSPLAGFTFRRAGKQMRCGAAEMRAYIRDLAELEKAGMRHEPFRFQRDGVVPKRYAHPRARVIPHTYSHYFILVWWVWTFIGFEVLELLGRMDTQADVKAVARAAA